MHGKFHTIGMSLQYQWLCVICGVCLETLVLQRYLYIFDTLFYYISEDLGLVLIVYALLPL